LPFVTKKKSYNFVTNFVAICNKKVPSICGAKDSHYTDSSFVNAACYSTGEVWLIWWM